MEPSSCEDNNSSSSVNPDEGRRSTMVRRVLPKEEEEGNSPPLHSVLPVRSNKRRCVSSACIPCRKRKSKCDGGSPGCSTCLAVYHTDCAYDFDGDHRRKGALKRDIEQLKEKNDSLDVIIATIRSASESEVGDIVNHIRQHGGLPADIATSIKENRPLSDGLLAPSLEADLSEMVEKFRVSGGGELKFLGYGPSWSDENLGPRESRSTSGSWTKVTSDIGFISDLLSLYFTWNHPCYVLFSKSCFLADMSKGRKKYCSSLLVNAILALACHFSDRPEARADPDDPTSTGEHFFREAKRILAVEGEASSLTSVQALALMSLHEAGCGRDSSGWMYSGRAFRMGLDMDFNLPLARLDLSPTEIEVRKITFWGCFTIDKMWSLFSGRIPLLPSTSIGIDKPVIFPSIESESWTPYSNRAVSDEPPQACRVQAIASRFCEVSEILGDVLPMLFAPKEPVTLTKLNTLYTRLKTWRGQLPVDMEAKNEALPSVLGLHIYYHATLLLLLRPFFKKEISVHGETPREICRRAANDIISLTTQYRKSYSLRHTVIQVPQVLLGASVILLMDLPSPSPSHAVPSNLVRSLKDLKELSGTWQWCNLTLRHIGELAEKWGIDLPKDVWNVISSTPMNPKPPSNHEIINATHVNHEYPNQHYHYGRPRSENPSDVMGNQSGNSGWGMLNDEDFQFVNSMISFPSVIDDWTCIGAPSRGTAIPKICERLWTVGTHL